MVPHAQPLKTHEHFGVRTDGRRRMSGAKLLQSMGPLPVRSIPLWAYRSANISIKRNFKFVIVVSKIINGPK